MAENFDAMHPVGHDPSWSESYYFNFVDPVSKLAMFTRMGFRPNDGWADALHVVYLEGQRVAFTYGRRDIGTDLSAYDGDLSAGHLTLHCRNPHKQWEIEYNGPAQDISDAAILLERSKLRPDDWFKPALLNMTLRFDCITEPHLTRSDDPAHGAFGHFEQSGRVAGQIALSGESWDVSGFGVRDKSWGPRDWGASQRNDSDNAESGNTGSGPSFSSPQEPYPFVNWFSMNFGEHAALGGSGFRHADGVIRGAGWIQREGENHLLNDVVIESEYRPNSILHQSVCLTGQIEDGEQIKIEGKILNVCPTKIPMRGGATFINEGLAEFTWDDLTGYGIAEHWHAVAIS